MVILLEAAIRNTIMLKHYIPKYMSSVFVFHLTNEKTSPSVNREYEENVYQLIELDELISILYSVPPSHGLFLNSYVDRNS